jgi:Family of unknown function (DUF5819)
MIFSITHTTKIKIFTLSIFALALVHFGLTSVYNLQQAKVPDSLRQLSNAYSAPLFHQNWKLFAPHIPEYSVDLEFRIPEGADWSAWQDVSFGNGHTSHSKIEYMEQSMCTALAWQVANNLHQEAEGHEFDRITASFDYSRAIYFAHELYLRKTGIDLRDSMQLRLNFRFNPPMGMQEKSGIDEPMEFPVYQIPEKQN